MSQNKVSGSAPVSPALRRVLAVDFALAAVCGATAIYLLGVRVLGHVTGSSYESVVAVAVFLVHLVGGLALLVPAVVYAILHMRRAWRMPNRAAVRMGFGLFATMLVLLASGLVLTRIENVLVVNDPLVRSLAYWLHVLSPLVAAWLFILHRLAGTAIRWRVGAAWLAASAAAVTVVVVYQAAPKPAVVAHGEAQSQYFPALVKTASGEAIPAELLMMDEYCRRCHADVHAGWSSSVHRFSSMSNRPYRFSVANTRERVLERDGNVHASRFCAGCHDLVPLLSGRWDDPGFDLENDPTGGAGITCSVCHSISSIDSPRGNADVTITAPVHYPFTFSQGALGTWVNRQLILSRPELHRSTFLKPVHRTAEFCSACHKVHLPEELNHYRWLRGQNHYDSFQLSGVSGHNPASFYYPPRAVATCAGCHMPLELSSDFGAQDFDDSGGLSVHDHLFAAANTAIPLLSEVPDEDQVVREHQEFLGRATRLDIFGLREGGTVNGRLVGPLRPELPALAPGETYLVEVVLRTVGVGHLLTQGTADSNQLWLEVEVTSGDSVLGRSGAMDAESFVDPWSHFVNAWIVDRDGKRIDRRNAEDIFVALYNNQIPPGATDTVHYLLRVPAQTKGEITIRTALKYRKFDTTYMRHVYGPEYVNTLPVTTMATDQVTLPVAAASAAAAGEPSAIPEWERWNDYGIGLLRKRGSGQLRQAEQAFSEVERLGRPEGPLNLARVLLREGRVGEEASQVLARAAAFDPPANAWTLLWLAGQVHRQNGRLDAAIDAFEQVVEGGFEAAAGRGFDFSKDYRLLADLGATVYQRALQERGQERAEQRRQMLLEAARWFDRVLELDPENRGAHYGLKQIYDELGDDELAQLHAAQHARYKLDDNARDRAIAAARRSNPAANHAAEAVVIYSLHGQGGGS